MLIKRTYVVDLDPYWDDGQVKKNNGQVKNKNKLLRIYCNKKMENQTGVDKGSKF